MIVTLPPVGKLWMSEETSSLAVIVHGVLFFVILKLIATNTFGLGWIKNVESEITGSSGVTL